MQDGVEYEKVIVRITSKIRAGYYTVKSLPIIMITLWPSVNNNFKNSWDPEILLEDYNFS